jgi:hypothetical protein
LSAAFILRDCSENSRELLFARSGGDYLTAGRPAIAVVSDENWSLVVYLPERHLQRLKVGQKVYCYIGSDPWKYTSAKIRSIAPGVSGRWILPGSYLMSIYHRLDSTASPVSG